MELQISKSASESRECDWHMKKQKKNEKAEQGGNWVDLEVAGGFQNSSRAKTGLLDIFIVWGKRMLPFLGTVWSYRVLCRERRVCSLNMFSNCGLGKDRYLAVLGSLLKATWDLASLRREIVVGYGEAWCFFPYIIMGDHMRKQPLIKIRKRETYILKATMDITHKLFYVFKETQFLLKWFQNWTVLTSVWTFSIYIDQM